MLLLFIYLVFDIWGLNENFHRAYIFYGTALTGQHTAVCPAVEAKVQNIFLDCNFNSTLFI